MKRRDFIKTTAIGGAAISTFPQAAFSQPKKEKVLASYYFLAGMYTLVPRSIRSELDEMADWGTDVVCIGATSLTIDRAFRNVNFIVEECHKRGMKVFVVPSRIAGITAGVPIVPSPFAALNPDTWIKNKEGKTPPRKVGAICSFYQPKVVDYFNEIVTKMLDLWDLDGFIWDEPKTSYWQDFSPMALKNNPTGDFRQYMKD